MKKTPLYLTALLFTTLSAADDESADPTPSNENESSAAQEAHIADRVVEVIAEAAINDRNYGKDIGDR
jgi:hypothetical protein